MYVNLTKISHLQIRNAKIKHHDLFPSYLKTQQIGVKHFAHFTTVQQAITHSEDLDREEIGASEKRRWMAEQLLVLFNFMLHKYRIFQSFTSASQPASQSASQRVNRSDQVRVV